MKISEDKKMKTNRDKLINIAIKIFIIFTLIICGIYYLYKGNLTLSIIKDSLSYSLILTSVITILIEKFLWKNILLICRKNNLVWSLLEDYETPILKEEYDCLINYNWNNISGTKETKIKVNQTYTSTNISLITDEIESNTVISEIIKENNKFVLYYIYETNPKAKFHEKNPTQLGGCKITLNSIKDIEANNKLIGKYWTTSKTIGDMELY